MRSRLAERTQSFRAYAHDALRAHASASVITESKETGIELVFAAQLVRLEPLANEATPKIGRMRHAACTCGR